MTRMRSSRRLAVAAPLAVALLLVSCVSVAQMRQRMGESIRAEQSYQRGLERYEAGEYEAAVPLFRRALELDPTHDDAEAYLAWSHYYTGQYVPATKHFREALRRQPKWEGLHDGLGWTRYRLKRYHLALESFRQALALDPTYRDARVGFAYALFELGRYAEALPYLEQLTVEGEGGAMRSAQKDVEEVRSHLAWTVFYLGDFQRAQAEFRKGLQAHPDWPGLHDGLGWSLLRLGDRAGARASFTRALQLQPGYADARDGLAALRQAGSR